MYFQQVLLVALSTQEQSTLVVVSPSLDVKAAPFHPGGILGARLSLASSWYPCASLQVLLCCTLQCLKSFGERLPLPTLELVVSAIGSS